MAIDSNPGPDVQGRAESNPTLDSLSLLGASTEMSDAARLGHMSDLLGWCNKFILDSNTWRRASFETNWHLYERNADSIYDPALVTRKESWQSKGFIPTTPTHRENIMAAMYRMILGAAPPLEVSARVPVQEPDQDQSDNVRDLIVREMERTRFPVALFKMMDDATVYGSGFVRIRFEERWEDRHIRSPQARAIDITSPASIMRHFAGKQPIDGYIGEIKPVRVYRGIKMEWLSVWDIFPDPKALTIPGNTIAYRFKMPFGDIVQGVQNKYYFPEAVSRLRNDASREIEPVERAISQADRGIAPSTMRRPDYGKKFECYEIYARLPKKWALVRGEPIDDPEKLVPCRVIFHPNVVLCVEVNEDWDGEPPIYKWDYFPVANRFFGRGVCEMLRGVQEVINETVNQRVDNVALVLNRMFAVIEKAVVNRQDLVSKPGGTIRLDAKYVQDVRQAFTSIDIPDVTVSAYKDVLEMERYAQERTSSRTNLGTSGITGDAANRTATGLEIVRQSAGEKFAMIGMYMEHSALYDIFRAFWKTIYANITPQDVTDALGPERAQTFKLMNPLEIEDKYRYEPQGIFTMENKSLTQQRIQALVQQFGQQPWFNMMAAFDKAAKANSFAPETLKYTPDEMSQMMQAQAHASGQVSPDQGQSVAGRMGSPDGQQGQQDGQQQPSGPPPDDERVMDEAAARIAVKSGKVSAKDAAERLRLKYGDAQ